MACEVKVIEDSYNAVTGDRISTVQARYWRSIHAEHVRHRVFSFGAGSSRAIPVKRVLSQVWNDPAGPIHWGSNMPGMQAKDQLTGWRRATAKALWRLAGKVACVFAWAFMKVGLHKQVANRILEPWQYINVLITGTDWENFFELRCHPDAQPEMQELAFAIRDALARSMPKELQPGEWHLPYVDVEERATLPLEFCLKLSTARSARVSFRPFDGDANHTREFQRHDDLLAARPIHASPSEHQAMAMDKPGRCRNFSGFVQYRDFVEAQLNRQEDVA